MGKTILAALLTLAISAATTADAAQSRIYKTVDAEGNVVFTDIPPREDTSAEQIIIENPNSFKVEEALGPADQWIVEPSDAEEVPFSYRSLNIASPADDETIRDNSGNVSVIAVTNPRLQSGHRLRLLMDGQPAQDGVQSQFDLQNVDRGSHSIALEIIDASGSVIKRSESSTFHLQRYRLPSGG